MRCSSRAERNAKWCNAVTPRIVASLLNANRPTDTTLVITVSVLQWSKPSPVQTSGFDLLLEYRREAGGDWRFSRLLGARGA